MTGGASALVEIRVTVVAGPSCPAEPIDSSCPPFPVSDAMVTAVRTSAAGAGTNAATLAARTDPTGRAVLRVPAGRYTVTAVGPPPMRSHDSAQALVGSTAVSVHLTIDSGIRLPIPGNTS